MSEAEEAGEADPPARGGAVWALVCRACLQRFPRAVLRPLTPPALALLREAAGLQIDPSEELPDKLCGTCLQRADDAAQFKIQCQQSERKLRSYLKEKERRLQKRVTSTPVHSEEVHTGLDTSSNGGDSHRSLSDSLILEHLPLSPLKAEDDPEQLSNFGEDGSITNFVNSFLEDELQISNPIEKLTSDSPAHIINPDSVLSFLKSEELGYHGNDITTEKSFSLDLDDFTKENTTLIAAKSNALSTENIDPTNKKCDKYLNDVIKITNVVTLTHDSVEATERRIVNEADEKSADPGTQDDNSGRDVADLKVTKQNHETVDIELVKTIKCVKKMVQRVNKMGLIKCHYCGLIYKDPEELYAHLIKFHEEVLRNILINMFKCNRCDKVFKAKPYLDDHLAMHERKMRLKEKKFVCAVCDKVFGIKCNLARHLKLHEDNHHKKLDCSICHLSFERMNALALHMSTHIRRYGTKDLEEVIKKKEQRPCFICPSCGKTLSNKSNLTMHMKHHEAQVHPCDVCKKELSTSQCLDRHMRSHTGNRPYKCNQCEKTFTRSDRLARHMHVHTREKLYKCGECFRHYQQSNDLRVHVNKDHGIGKKKKNKRFRDKAVPNAVKPKIIKIQAE